MLLGPQLVKRSRCDFSRIAPVHRYYGRFECATCARTWQSTSSWLNYRQRCPQCHVMVQPCELRLNKTDTIGPAPADHPRDACERCLGLGFPCRELRLNDTSIPKSKPRVENTNSNNSNLNNQPESQYTKKTLFYSVISSLSLMITASVYFGLITNS